MASQFNWWQQQQLLQQQQQLAAQAQQGGDPYLQQLYAQGQQGNFPPPDQSTGPYMGGQSVASPQQGGGAPPKPSAGAQLGQVGGQLGGQMASQAAYNSLFGGTPAAAAPAATGGMTGITGTSAMGSIGGATGAGATAATGATATEAALGIGAAAPGATVGGATTFATAEAATAAGYTAVGTAAEGGVIAVPAAQAGWAAYAGPAAIAAAAAATAYQSYQNYGDAKKNAAGGGMTKDEVASIYDPWRSSIGEKIPGHKAINWVQDHGPTALLYNSVFGSKKHEDQLYRERAVGRMKKAGFLDENNQYTLSDGSTFDFGVDGKHTLQNVGSNIDGKAERRRYDVDFSDERSGGTTAILQGLGAIMTGTDKKMKDQITGKLVNAAMSSGDVRANIDKMFADAGLDHAKAYNTIHQMAEAKQISAEFADSVKNSLDEYWGVGAYADGKQAPSQVPDAFAPKSNKPQPTGAPQAGVPRDPGMGNGGTNEPRTNAAPTPQPAARIAAQKPTPKDNNVKPRGPWINLNQSMHAPRGILSVPRAQAAQPRGPIKQPPRPNSNQVIRGR